ncbi:hypothetical protein OPV22_002895 [Ensete ventricosum]|uniref:Secreted protein n=1 Tax=Ensete ventricosum TaxID=4639 RepID=A0AAV8RZ89_ENSVE|nr:hypothetical protein OPV22_002895 [Ensete ventricosum]
MCRRPPFWIRLLENPCRGCRCISCMFVTIKLDRAGHNRTWIVTTATYTPFSFASQQQLTMFSVRSIPLPVR